MFPSIVVGWMEFAAASTVLLGLTKAVVDRLRQPVDRVNFIVTSLIVSACIPLLLGQLDTPSLKLGLLADPSLPTVTDSIDSRARVGLAAPADTHNISSNKDEPNSSAIVAANPMPARRLDAATNQTVESSASNSSINPTAYKPISVWALAAILLALFHCAMFVWFCFQLVLGTWQLRVIAYRAAPADDSILAAWQRVAQQNRKSVRLLVTRDIDVPLVYGAIRPTVLIPAAIASGDRATLDFCLMHEWSHIQCHDLRKWQIVNLCQLLFWYQPLYWILRRELRICQDLIADDLAANTQEPGIGRVAYSELLLSLAKRAQTKQPITAMAIYGHSSSIGRRIKRLLTGDQALRWRSKRQFAWFVGCALVLIAAFVGSIRFSSAQAQEQSGIKDQQSTTNGQTTPNDTKIVKGKVVNAAGQPVAGARVWLPMQHRPRLTLEAATDASGDFELHIPANKISSRITETEWIVWAYAPGNSIQTQSIRGIVLGKDNNRCNIQLPPSSQTSFRIAAPDGVQQPNVLVKPANYKTMMGYSLVPDEMLAHVAARTDENGLALLPALESKPLFMIEMEHPQFGRQTMRVDTNKSEAIRTIKLIPVASIKGRLVGSKPEWMQNVPVAFTTDNDEFDEARGLAETVTDQQGHFEVPKMASGGPLRMYVAIDPKLPVRPVINQDIHLVAGETTELQIPLEPAPRVRGKVVSKSTGQPVVGAEVSLGYGGFQQSDHVVTSSSGEYEGRCLPGDLSIHIIYLPNGYVQLGTPWNKSYKVPKDVEEFNLPVIEVVGSHEIRGTLVDSKDRPLPNMQVLAVDGNRRYGFGTSDADGRFNMKVPDGVDTTIEVYVDKRGSFPTQVVQPEPLVVKFLAQDREREIMLQRQQKADVVLIGRVLSAGKPVANVSISLLCGFPVAGVSPDRAGMRFEQVYEMKTDSSGTYRLTGLKAGDSYRLVIKPPFPAADPGFNYQSPYVARLDKDAPAEVTLPEINLRQMTQTVAGVVVDPEDKPVPGVTVTAQLRNGQHLGRYDATRTPPWTTTDAQGRFRLTELPAEPLTLMAYISNPKGGPIRFPSKVKVEMNQQNVRIVFDPTLLEELP